MKSFESATMFNCRHWLKSTNPLSPHLARVAFDVLIAADGANRSEKNEMIELMMYSFFITVILLFL